MALPGLGDVIEIAMVHVFDSVDEQINVWNAKVAVAGGGSENDFNDDLLEMLGGMYAIVESDISDRVAVTEIRWRNVTDDGPTIFVPWAGTYTGGTGSGDALPPQVAALLLLRTGVKGVQGRKYLPTYTEPTQSGGILTAGTLGRLQTFAAEVASQQDLTLTEISLAFHVWSKVHGQSYPVSAVQARQRVAIQRRRSVGRGS